MFALTGVANIFTKKVLGHAGAYCSRIVGFQNLNDNRNRIHVFLFGDDDLVMYTTNRVSYLASVSNVVRIFESNTKGFNHQRRFNLANLRTLLQITARLLAARCNLIIPVCFFEYFAG